MRSTPGPSDLERVEIDLAPHVVSAKPGARIYQVTSEDQLIKGDIAHGKVGDYILENDTVRYLIESDDRVMNPCPHGGTPLDASYKGGEDILGEVCMFVNAAQTLDPEKYEITEAFGRPVLAVTGTLALGDYINILGMAGEFVPDVANLPFNPDEILPLTVTVYYILGAEDKAMKIVTAFRNESEERQDIVVAHLVVSGGDGRYYNPGSSLRGFGTQGSDFLEEKWPFIAFTGEESSYLFMPEPTREARPQASIPLPYGGVYITISGVAAVATGVTSILGPLLAPVNTRPNIEGVLSVQPGETVVSSHWFMAGDGAVSTMLDEAYAKLNVPTQTLSGVVTDANGTPEAGVRVSAVRDRVNLGQAISAVDGSFAMPLPAGNYDVKVRRGGRTGATTASVDTADVADLQVVLDAAATIEVTVTTPDGAPTPARVTVICDENPCPQSPGTDEVDTTANRLPSGWAAIEWLGMDGQATIELPPGDYKVVVSRGFEWSLWPRDANTAGGQPVSLAQGDNVQIDAEIAPVLDTAGALSGDFHVHALPSPDSTVLQLERALNFLAEGVDVIVSTDHDIISDYKPSIEALGAETQLASFIGAEITTSDIGHYNAFPLQRDPTKRRGGNIDWSPDFGLDPVELFAKIREQPGDKVIQVNHPQSLGLINMTETDVLTGISLADRELHRLKPKDPDPVTGDTGLWSEEFTAMELMTGSSTGRFYGVGRWWFTMLGRGFTPTATAVTDTHRKYGDLGGSPRSYIFVSDTTDEPSTIDSAEFVESVNAGKLVGSRGPFVELSVQNGSGTMIGLGETLATEGSPVTATLRIQTPDWFTVDRVKVFMNVDVTADIGPGTTIEDAITPTMEVPLAAMTSVPADFAGYTRNEVTADIEMTTSEDAWVVFVVEGSGNMNPLTRGQSPFAYTNPIYLDADGGGYDKPPLADVAAAARDEAMTGGMTRLRNPHAVELPMTTEKANHVLHHLSCSAEH